MENQQQAIESLVVCRFYIFTEIEFIPFVNLACRNQTKLRFRRQNCAIAEFIILRMQHFILACCTFAYQYIPTLVYFLK